MNWPDTLPLPDYSPLDWTINMGLARTNMQAGNSRQRRVFDSMPTFYQLNWSVQTQVMLDIVAWVQQHGYDWFQLTLPGLYPGIEGKRIDRFPIRLISSFDVSGAGHDYFRMSVVAEVSPDLYDDLFDDGWVIAGGPGLAFVTGWRVGGSPLSPSPATSIPGTPADPVFDWNVSGTPANPNGAFGSSLEPSSEWVIGLYPIDELDDFVIGGTPEFPTSRTPP